MASPDDLPLREFALPPSPCRSPMGADTAMSVWVEAASDGEPRVRVALQSPTASAPSRPPPPPPSSAAEFPLVLVGESRAMATHDSTPSAAIVPFQKLQMDTDLHQTTLPSPTSQSQSQRQRGAPSPGASSSRAAAAFGSAFHGGDAMSHNFMEAMRLGELVARPQEPQLSVRLRGSRVELASGSEDDAVDFLGPAENIKKLFKLPYSQGPVSLAVHRVGSTLVVDGGIDDADLPPGFGDDDGAQQRDAAAPVYTQTKSIEHHQQAREDEQSQQLLYEKFIYQSTATSRLLGSDKSGGAEKVVSEAASPEAVPEPTPFSRSASKTSLQAHHQNQSSGKSTHHLSDSQRKRQAQQSVPSASEFSSFPTEETARHAPSPASHAAPAAFQRVLKWKFSDLKMVLGSDVMLFSNPEHPAVSLRLHDMDKELSLATVLDYYLDNVIANIPELAICMHSKGVVRGYKLVETRQIPHMSGDAARPLFDVQEVSLNAAMLLKFLKNNCTRPNGTYWLHRKQGESALRLYDVNVLSQGKQLKWKYMMAMLCYRFASRASRMMYSLTTETPRLQKQLRLRQRDLLRTCVNLLKEIAEAGGAAHNSIRSSVAEQLADTYLREGDDECEDYSVNAPEKHATSASDRQAKQSIKAEAFVHAKKYLTESIRLFEECMRAESDADALPSTGAPSGEAVEASGPQTHDDDDGGMNEFMVEELQRLRLKCSSINLQLARVRIDEQKWDSVVGCIQDALVHIPRSFVPRLSETLRFASDDSNEQIDRLLASIDFDGVRQKDESSYGGAFGDAASRVCITASELRCCVLEVIGDAASKQPVDDDAPRELLRLFRLASGEESGNEEQLDFADSTLLLRHIAFSAYLRALFPAVDSELYFRLMKKLGNACNELGKHYLSTTLSHATTYRWFERGCRVFKDIEDSVNVALLSANLAHLHKILAQQEASDFVKQQAHYSRAVQLCLNAASLLKHHKMEDAADLYHKVTGELALSYLVWGVALANTNGSHRDSREAEAPTKFSKALALYTEMGDVKQIAATHYQIASFHARQISREVDEQHASARVDSGQQKQSSGLKNRMEIARRHYEKALEYFGRNELGVTFILIHQELADLYALGGRVDDLDHALLVLLNTVHAFQSAHQQVQPLAANVMAKIQAVVHQLIRVSAVASSSASSQGKRSAASSKDDGKAAAPIDVYKCMYKEVLYFNAAAGAADSATMEISPTLRTLLSIYDQSNA